MQSHTWFPAWTWFSQFLSLMNLNKYINKRCQLSSLAANGWIAGDQRGKIRHQRVKAHSCSDFSPCFNHTSPTQTDNGTSQIDHDIGAYVPYSFWTTSQVKFYVPFQHSLKYKYEGDKANSLTSPPNDTIIWTEKGVLQLAWSYQFFKDLGWWSGQGLNSQHPAQQTGALPTELTGHPEGSPPVCNRFPSDVPCWVGGEGGNRWFRDFRWSVPSRDFPIVVKFFVTSFFT